MNSLDLLVLCLYYLSLCFRICNKQLKGCEEDLDPSAESAKETIARLKHTVICCLCLIIILPLGVILFQFVWNQTGVLPHITFAQASAISYLIYLSTPKPAIE